MRILFLCRLYHPHIGGVEKHVYEVTQNLRLKTHEVKIITSANIKYPKIKFLGLLYIWYFFWKNRKLILESDLIHAHDVFIWYLPFKFLFPGKKIYTTFHGWEGEYPVPLKNIILKRLAAKLSDGTIAIGSYIEKYYGIKADMITYGGVSKTSSKLTSLHQAPQRGCSSYGWQGSKIVFVGRLEYDTGIKKLFDFLDTNKNYSVDFCGDGSLRKICAKYGVVHGFIDPTKYYQRASICFAGGYLSALEALNYRCKLMVGWDNPLKRDYWRLSPFWNYENIKKLPTWEEVTEIYEKLWEK